MAVCHAQKVFPKNLISSLGSLGCGWHRLMPSSSACTTFGLHQHRNACKQQQLRMRCWSALTWQVQGCWYLMHAADEPPWLQPHQLGARQVRSARHCPGCVCRCLAWRFESGAAIACCGSVVPTRPPCLDVCLFCVAHNADVKCPPAVLAASAMLQQEQVQTHWHAAD